MEIPTNTYEEKFGKNKEEIKTYISSLGNNRAIIDIKIDQIKAGTKADVYFVSEQATSNGPYFPTYVFKVYRADALDITGKQGREDYLRRYNLEKKVLQIANEHFKPNSYNFSGGKVIGLYPTMYKKLNALNGKIITLEAILHPSLDEEVKKALSEEETLKICVEALNPLILHHGSLSSYKGEIEGIEKPTAEDYCNKFLTYFEIISQKKRTEWPNGTEKKLQNFAKLAQKYLISDKTVVKHNCYPWENKIISLIDAGGIKMGSPAIDLGCMFLHPNIYTKLNHAEGAIKYFADKYIEKMQTYANESG